MLFTYDQLPKIGKLIYIYREDGGMELFRYPHVSKKPLENFSNWHNFNRWKFFAYYDYAPEKLEEFVNL